MAYFAFHLFEHGLETASLGVRDLRNASEAQEVALKLAAVGCAASANALDRSPRQAEIRINDDANNPIALVLIDPSPRLIDPAAGPEAKRTFDRLLQRSAQAQARAALAWLEAIRAEQDLRAIKARAERLLSQPFHDPLSRKLNS